jgi:hypothetical protein
MIFNNKKDIKSDIKSKAFRFYDNNISSHTSIKDLYKELTPLLNNYLYELKILKDIISFDVNINNNDVNVYIQFILNNNITNYTLNVGINIYKKEKRITKITNFEQPNNLEYIKI